MKKLLTLLMIIALLIALGAAKVILFTNPMLGLSIILGAGLFIMLCWFYYQNNFN